jgi:hypothetical protein
MPQTKGQGKSPRIPERYGSGALSARLSPYVTARLARLDPYPDLGLFDVGNGDATGFYRPCGADASDPIVCEMDHDGHYLSVSPVAGSNRASPPGTKPL